MIIPVLIFAAAEALSANTPPILPSSQPVVQENVVTPRKRPTPLMVRVEVANQKALVEPSTDNYMNAAQLYPYAESALYRLYAAPGHVSDVALEPGEVLSAISAGDTVRWTVGDTASGSGTAKQVHVLVKPFAPGLRTNLVILTDRHTYHLELLSTAHVSMEAVSWTYPSAGLIAAKSPAIEPQPPVNDGLTPEKLNFGYRIEGASVSWKPIRVFDDGSKVYIAFADGKNQVEAPPLFVVGSDGASELVNYRVRGNYYIVDRLFAVAELRLGSDKQQVVRILRDEPVNPSRLDL